MTWQEWISTKQGLQIINRAAKIINRKIQTAGLESFLSEYANQPEEISSSLWIYLSERAGEWDKKRPLGKCLMAGERYILSLIANSFFNHLKDKVRTKGLSPSRYLYSRLRSVLSSRPNVFVVNHGNVAYYSFDDRVPFEAGHIYMGGNIEHNEWAFPDDVSSGNIHSEETVVRVAEYFWRLITGQYSRPLWIRVKDLAAYVMTFLDIPTSTKSEDPDFELEGLPDKDWNGDHKRAERSLMQSFLKNLAECCAGRLSHKEKAVIFKIFCENQTLEQVARDMNYSSPSAVAYIREKAFEKIRECCAAEPGLSPPDLDEEVFNDFMENLLEFCKK